MADAPPALVTLAQKGATAIGALDPDAAKALRYALYLISERSLIPWINTQEGQEVASVVNGIFGKLIGSGAAGPIAQGVEQGTDTTIRQLVAILTAAPAAPGATT